MNNIEALASCVENIMGADPLRAGRTRPVVEARVLLVAVLRAQGYTQQRIADLLGFARISIQHYDAIFRDAMTYPSRPEIVKGWKKLQKIYDI